MKKKQPPPWNYNVVYLGRQPFFDPQLQPQGHELLYRSQEHSQEAIFLDGEDATLSVIHGSYGSPFLETRGEHLLMVNFTLQAILNRAPFALPPYRTVIKISGTPDKTPEKTKVLDELRHQGYQVALDHELSTCLDWQDHIDICIGQAQVLGQEGQDLLQKAQEHGLRVMAKQVEEQETFQALKQAGVDLFQGFFFQKPEVLRGVEISTHHALRLKILRILQQQEPDLDQLADLLEKEVSLAYRILKFVNSAYFSTRVEITSLRHALAYVGLNQLRTLLEIFLLRSMTPESKPSELPFLSVHRGRFLEILGQDHPDFSSRREALFLLGLFSLLDAIFDTSMDQVLENLPLDAEIERALLREESRYLPWLELAIAFEEASWDQVDDLVDRLGLSPPDVAMAYSQALAWTRELFEYWI